MPKKYDNLYKMRYYKSYDKITIGCDTDEI